MSLILITGGAKSGKSAHAEKLAKGHGEDVVYVATYAGAEDEEMRQKIEEHRRRRPSRWATVENRFDVEKILQELPGSTKAVIVDSLALWVSRFLTNGSATVDWPGRLQKICERARSSSFPVIVVTDEVGFGLVPQTKIGRDFREALGRANQIAASQANEVYLMVSGIPLKLKG